MAADGLLVNAALGLIANLPVRAYFIPSAHNSSQSNRKPSPARGVPLDLARLVLAALYTGCRIGKLVRMRCSQVGRDGYGVYIQPFKTYRPRFVFLPDEGMAWFVDQVKG